MSDQTKGNMQVIGAGVMGFIAVVGVAGLVLTHDSGQGSLLSRASTPAPSLAAPEPAVSRQAPSPKSFASSPAPIIGSVADDVVARAPAAPDSAAQAAADGRAAEASQASGLGELGAPRHAGAGDSRSSARVDAAVAPRETAPAPQAAPAYKPVPRIALDKNPARGSIASAVHYGVTSRDQLMGKAAGPVYNFTGRQVAGGANLAALSKHADAQMTEAERGIESSNLPPEQKERMRRELRSARAAKAVAE